MDEDGQDVEKAKEEQSGNSTNSWLADLKFKIAAFATNDFLSSFGFTRRKHSSSASAPGSVYETDEGNRASSTRRMASEPPTIQGSNTCWDSDIEVQTLKGVNNIDVNILSPISSGESTEESVPTPTGSDGRRPDSPFPEEILDQLASELTDGLLGNPTDADYSDFHIGYADTLELQHFGTYKNLIPSKRELGKGHDFQETSLLNPTWCDKCGDFIWGIFRQAVKCKSCHYTCHWRCVQLVTLDCRSVTDSLKSTKTETTALTASTAGSEVDPSDVAIEEDLENISDPLPSSHLFPVPLPRLEKLEELIAAYNETSGGLNMTLEENGHSFTGFIRIHMNFGRPINVVAGERLPTMFDVVNSEETLQQRRKTINSFFLPRNTVKVLHISSDTTTQEMIVKLLKKFKVADNPRKFALYERCLESGKTLQAKLARIPEQECPLRLSLLWGSQTEKRFVLQENETGDIAWDAFEVPELQNFLLILDREEQLYLHQIRRKYDIYKKYLLAELRYRGAPAPEDPFDPTPQPDDPFGDRELCQAFASTNPFVNPDTGTVKSTISNGSSVDPSLGWSDTVRYQLLEEDRSTTTDGTLNSSLKSSLSDSATVKVAKV